jgi:hypothetical protein
MTADSWPTPAEPTIGRFCMTSQLRTATWPSWPSELSRGVNSLTSSPIDSRTDACAVCPGGRKYRILSLT